MTAQWYALQSKPMKESILCEQLSLRARQVSVELPAAQVQPKRKTER